jgi:hypothetical protein
MKQRTVSVFEAVTSKCLFDLSHKTLGSDTLITHLRVCTMHSEQLHNLYSSPNYY